MIRKKTLITALFLDALKKDKNERTSDFILPLSIHLNSIKLKLID